MTNEKILEKPADLGLLEKLSPSKNIFSRVLSELNFGLEELKMCAVNNEAIVSKENVMFRSRRTKTKTYKVLQSYLLAKNIDGEIRSIESQKPVLEQTIDRGLLLKLAGSRPNSTRAFCLITGSYRDTEFTNRQLLDKYNDGCFRHIGKKSFNIINEYMFNKGLIDVKYPFIEMPEIKKDSLEDLVPKENAQIQYKRGEKILQKQIYVAGILREKEPMLIYGENLDAKTQKIMDSQKIPVKKILGYNSLITVKEWWLEKLKKS